MPGRLIGVSVDVHGHMALRMALATREQYIRREKATSNICTAQALLANIAAMYAVYHGPDGLRAIATRVHALACQLESGLTAMGLRQTNPHFFDTLCIALPGGVEAVCAAADSAGINFRVVDTTHLGISLDETVTADDVRDTVNIFAGMLVVDAPHVADAVREAGAGTRYPAPLRRTSSYLTHPVFNVHHSETAMMRYIRSLERKDLGLDSSMIPLGSCTMKLSAASAMRPITWEPFG